MADPDYFTLAEFRELPDMGEARFTDARIEVVAAAATATIERVVGTSFVARSQTATLDGTGGTTLPLPHAYVLSLTALSFSGTAQTVGDFGVLPGGVVYATSGAAFPSGSRNIVATYDAGYSSTPPADIKDAAMWATRARLLETNSASVMNDRRSSVTDATGGTTTFVIPGEDRPFGYPLVDAVVLGWRSRLAGFGFA